MRLACVPELHDTDFGFGGNAGKTVEERMGGHNTLVRGIVGRSVITAAMPLTHAPRAVDRKNDTDRVTPVHHCVGLHTEPEQFTECRNIAADLQRIAGSAEALGCVRGQFAGSEWHSLVVLRHCDGYVQKDDCRKCCVPCVG